MSIPRKPRRRLGTAFARLALATSLVVASRAQAADLAWSAPAGCPDPSGVVAQVERLLGGTLTSVPDVDFEVRIARLSADNFQLVLLTQPHAGGGEARSRELTGRSCEEVAEAAAVAIAMTVSGGEAPATSEPAANTPPDEAGPPALAPGATEPPAEPVKAASPVGFAVGAGVALDLGALPQLAPGASAALSLLVFALRVELQATVFAAQETTLAGSTNGGEFSLTTGSLFACAERALRLVRVLGCGGFELGELSARGVGADHRYRSTTGYRALRAEGGLLTELGAGFGLALRVGVTVPLTRHEFLLDDTDRIHKPGSLTGRALLGVEFSL